MKIGVPKEIKPQENRIGLTPDSVKILTSNGHQVLIENNGGFEAGFENVQYEKAGAKIVKKAEDIFKDNFSDISSPSFMPLLFKGLSKSDKLESDQLDLQCLIIINFFIIDFSQILYPSYI